VFSPSADSISSTRFTEVQLSGEFIFDRPRGATPAMGARDRGGC
jgi:hypothetical protein